MRPELISIYVKMQIARCSYFDGYYARYFERGILGRREYKSGIEAGTSVNGVFNDSEHFENSPNDLCA